MSIQVNLDQVEIELLKQHRELLQKQFDHQFSYRNPLIEVFDAYHIDIHSNTYEFRVFLNHYKSLK